MVRIIFPIEHEGSINLVRFTWPEITFFPQSLFCFLKCSGIKKTNTSNYVYLPLQPSENPTNQIMTRLLVCMLTKPLFRILLLLVFIKIWVKCFNRKMYQRWWIAYQTCTFTFYFALHRYYCWSDPPGQIHLAHTWSITCYITFNIAEDAPLRMRGGSAGACLAAAVTAADDVEEITVLASSVIRLLIYIYFSFFKRGAYSMFFFFVVFNSTLWSLPTGATTS